MKVNVTYDVPDNARMIIGAIATGKMQMANREQVRAYASSVFGKTLESAVARLEQFQTALAEQIVAEAESIVAEADNADK